MIAGIIKELIAIEDTTKVKSEQVLMFPSKGWKPKSHQQWCWKV